MLKRLDFVLQMFDFVFKMMNFILKMMNFGSLTGDVSREGAGHTDDSYQEHGCGRNAQGDQEYHAPQRTRFPSCIAWHCVAYVHPGLIRARVPEFRCRS